MNNKLLSLTYRVLTTTKPSYLQYITSSLFSLLAVFALHLLLIHLLHPYYK